MTFLPFGGPMVSVDLSWKPWRGAVAVKDGDPSSQPGRAWPTLWEAMVMGSLGAIMGSQVGYCVGRFGGRPFVRR